MRAGEGADGEIGPKLRASIRSDLEARAGVLACQGFRLSVDYRVRPALSVAWNAWTPCS